MDVISNADKTGISLPIGAALLSGIGHGGFDIIMFQTDFAHKTTISTLSSYGKISFAAIRDLETQITGIDSNELLCSYTNLYGISLHTHLAAEVPFLSLEEKCDLSESSVRPWEFGESQKEAVRTQKYKPEANAPLILLIERQFKHRRVKWIEDTHKENLVRKKAVFISYLMPQLRMVKTNQNHLLRRSSSTKSRF